MVGKPAVLVVIPENIPAEMRAENDWVCWKLEFREATTEGKEGKWTKVPYNPTTGARAASNSPETWVSFDVALRAYRDKKGGYDGVGFCLPHEPGGELIGVDLDGVIDSATGEFLEWRLEQRGKRWAADAPSPSLIVESLASYAERSPSGRGVRVFCRGQLWPDGRHQGAIEVYDSVRFLTVTGHHIEGTPATINTTNILPLLRAKFFGAAPLPSRSKKKPPRRRVVSTKQLPATDIVELARRAKNGQKFDDLYRGNIGGYASQSEADAALCMMLAFYAGPSGRSEVDAAFRASGLMRDKWDESRSSDGSSYGEMTVSSAIAQCSEFYERNGQAKVDENGDLLPNEAINDPHRLARVNLERYEAVTGGGKIRYWREEWFVYKHNRYRRLGCKEFAAKVAGSIKEEFNRANIEDQLRWEDKRQADPKYDEPRPEAQKVTKTLVSNVVQATTSTQILSAEVELNSLIDGTGRRSGSRARNWIAMANGIVDVDAFLDDRELDEVLLPHTSDWFSTVCLPYNFDPDATCPRWEAFLERCMEGDQDLIAVLQEWAGYLLLPDTSQQKFVINEGEGGNGKSVYIAGVQALLGEDNCSAVPLDKFSGQFDLTETLGKLANICGDMGEIDKIGEGHLKSFVSGDRMLFSRKNLSGINTTPTARLMFNTNNRPRFGDKSSGIWRRLLLIPWNVTIAAAERVLGMDNVAWWQASGELPGMLLWAVRGLHRLRMQKAFTYSEKIEEGLNSYRREVNPAREFLLENLELHPTTAIRTKSLYDLYRKWTEQNGNQPMAATVFGREVFRAFPEIARDRSPSGDRHWRYTGIRWSHTYVCGDKPDEYPLFEQPGF